MFIFFTGNGQNEGRMLLTGVKDEASPRASG